MRARVPQIVGLIGLALLSACGFTPMYAPGPGGSAAIGPIAIGQIDGRAGHVLRTELDRMLSVERGAAGPQRHLDVTLTEQVGGLGLRLDESSSRAELRLTALYVLTQPDGPELRGTLTSIVNYEVPNAAYAAIAAQDDARERAAETMAERLRAELALRLAQARRGD